MGRRARTAVVASTLLSLALTGATAPASAAPNGRIAFSGPAPGIPGPAIRTIRDDGTHLRTLVHGIHPSWSPDGRRLTYIDWGPIGISQQIVTVRSDGSSVVPVTTGGTLIEFEPAWSPDGRLIAFTAVPEGQETTELFTVRTDGTRLRRLTHDRRDEGWPAWRPDGGALAEVRFWGRGPCGSFGICTELWVVGRRGAWERRVFDPVTDPDGGDRWAVWGGADWSPDGRWIVFAGEDPSGTTDGLWMLRSDGATQPRHLAPGITEPSWSPDGRRLVGLVTRYDPVIEEDRTSIVIVRVDGSHRRVILRGGFGDEICCPDWGRQPPALTSGART